MHQISQDHSPYDLVAWHGNVIPYKYDLTKFSSQNSTSIDHTDPSINTVLTAKSRDPNTPLADFLWFGPRYVLSPFPFFPTSFPLFMGASPRPPSLPRGTRSPSYKAASSRL